MKDERDEKIEILEKRILLLEAQIRQETKKIEISKKKQLGFLYSELSCSICFEVFVSPVRLPCLHTFCLTCVLQNQQKQCPLCRVMYIFGPGTRTNHPRIDLLLICCIEFIIEFAYNQNEKIERDKLEAEREDLEKRLLSDGDGSYLNHPDLKFYCSFFPRV